MALRWTEKAHQDLARLHAFLEPASPVAAARVVRTIVAGVRRLVRHPRIGKRLSEHAPREVRSVVVADYEIRYEIRDSDTFVLRVWHVHEDR